MTTALAKDGPRFELLKPLELSVTQSTLFWGDVLGRVRTKEGQQGSWPLIVVKEKRAPANPSSVAEEKNFAEWVLSKHNGGEGRASKIPDYLSKTLPIWERTYCLAGSGAKSPGYIYMTALDPK